MDSFVEFKWNKKAREKATLPDIGYPVPIEALAEVIKSDGYVRFEYMLYWCQEFCSINPDKWPSLEPAMRRLAELIAPPHSSTLGTVGGDSWALRVGEVHLDAEIVTIQRNDVLLAAMMPFDDGTLVLSVYTPLDATAIRKVFALACRPHPEHGVAMRENNWEYARDCSCLTTSAVYALEKGQCYLSYWEYGLGINGDKTIDETYAAQRNATPMPVNQTAVQLGVFYQLSPDDSL